MSFKRFNFIVTGTITLLLIFVASVNFYTLRYTTKLIDRNDRVAKLHYINKLLPRSVILGTSRGKYGYDPDNGIFPKGTYNLSVNDMKIGEAHLFIEHLSKQKNLKHIFLALDYIMFCNPERVDQQLRRIVSSKIAEFGQLLSIDILRESLRKKKKKRKFSSIHCENGFSYGPKKVRDRKLFHQKISQHNLY